MRGDELKGDADAITAAPRASGSGSGGHGSGRCGSGRRGSGRRGSGRRWTHRWSRAAQATWNLHPVADLGYGLDGEGGRLGNVGQPADLGDTAINGVLADDAPAPAAGGQRVTRNDRAACFGQGDEGLHDARFDQRLSPARGDGSSRGLNPQIGDVEIGKGREVDDRHGIGRFDAVGHRHFVGEKSAFLRPCVLSMHASMQLNRRVSRCGLTDRRGNGAKGFEVQA